MSAAGWLYVALVPLCGVAGLAALLQRNPDRVARWGDRAGAACLVLCGAAWVARWVEAGHLPLFGTYESALSLAFATVLAAALWDLSGRGGPVLPLACLAAALLLAHGSGFDATPYALTISERSWVVDVHALLAWAAFAVLAVSCILAILVLLRRGEGTDADGRGLTAALSVGFFLHTGMMVSGSVYKFMLFGRAWSFDPIEVLGFAAWACYGTLLHLRLLGRWSGRRMAAWTLATFVLLVVSYRVIVYFPPWSTYHIFDMDRRIHLVGEEAP